MFLKKRSETAILCFIICCSFPHISLAEPEDGVSIGELAAMEPHEAIKYIHHEASMRVLTIGKAQGDRVLRCLDDAFVEFKANTDGSHTLPRGLQAAIQLIHRHNNNGGENLAAAAQIREIVDLVAQRACGVSSASISQ
jgi:hypothetical protein